MGSNSRAGRASFIVIVLLLAATTYAASWSGDFQFNPGRIGIDRTVRDGESFDVVAVHDGSSRQPLDVVYGQEPGKPNLPCWMFTLVVPQGMRVAGVETEARQSVEIAGGLNLMPAQEPVTVSETRLPRLVTPDPAVYGSDVPYPARHAEASPLGIKSGFRLVTVFLNPLQYRAETGKLMLATDLSVKVTYEADPTARAEYLTERQLRLFGGAVKSLVYNRRDVSRYSPRKRSSDWGNIDCVIITSSTLQSHFQPLVDWHNKKGYKTEVRTTSWIYSNYTGTDNQEKIRNFVRDYYTNQGLMWVVLGGDNSVVPNRQARAVVGSYTGNIPCDLYYVDLQWSWDGDGDRIYGEANHDTVDLYYDLYVGRASVDNAAQCSTFVNKVIRHETNPPTDYLRRILLVDAPLWTGYNHEQSNDSIANITPSGWTDRHFHSPTTTTAVRDSLNHGFQFCHLVGHGNNAGVYNGGTRIYGTTVTSGHTNGPRVNLLNSIACYSGNFEASDCCAEAAHNVGTGGSVAVLMNSRYGWGQPPSMGPSEKLDIRFYDYFFNHDTMPIGLTHAVSKEYYRAWAMSQQVWRWCYYELMVFGDPLLMMYEDVPTGLATSFSSPIPTGTQNFTVTVTSGGSAVNHALVCAVKGSEVYERGFTNSSGQVTLSINPITGGYMQVTATAADHLPHDDSCLVVAPTHDVGCGRIAAPTATVDSGTVVTPRGVVYNYGTQTVTNVPVEFRLGSTYCDTQTVASLNGGDSATVSFAGWTATPGTYAMKCSTMLATDTITGNDKTTGSVFVRHLDAAALVIVQPTGTVNRGATVTPRATVRNNSNSSQTFQVLFRITDGYSDTRAVTLGAGAQTTVSFSNWTATTAGSFTTACSTRLTGDMVGANNRQTGAVFVQLLDARTVSITQPTGSVAIGTIVTPRAVVRNDGNTSQTFDVRFSITDGYANTQSVTLAAGAQTTVSFSNWTANTAGAFTTACSTRLAGDVNNANDRQTGSVVVTNTDAQTLLIVQPTGIVNQGSSVTPQATVRNNSTTSQTFDVRFTISDGYANIQSVTLAAGAQTTVSFANWSAPTVGSFTTACSTRLAGDLNTSNDKATDSVLVQLLDGQTVSIVQPTGTVVWNGTVSPLAVVRNNGNSTQTFDVRFVVSDGYSNTQPVTLAAGAQTTVTFAPWTSSTPGLFQTACSTRLAGDMNTGNDKRTGNVLVERLDVEVVLLSSPVGTVPFGSSVVPVADVRNNGNTDQTFDVRFDISDGYTDTRSIMLAAGATTTVNFTNWTATTPGSLATACSTRLSGDQVNSNDRLTGSVLVRFTDVACEAIVAPVDTMDSTGVCAVQARVANNGSSAETFDVVFSIAGPAAWSDTATVTGLMPGSTSVVDFTDWPVGPRGSYTTACSTRLAGDQQESNDRAADGFLVRVCDVAAVAVLAPTGMVDSTASESVRVVVANYGSLGENLGIRLTIGADYDQARNVMVAAGVTDTFAMPNWTVGLPRGGWWPAVCSVVVSGDEFPDNNVALESVFVNVDDAMVGAIIAPVGTVDSGAAIAPVAAIVNSGTVDGAFDVYFRISDGFSSVRTCTVAAGVTDTVTFDSWDPGTPATYLTSCSTALVTDVVPANDFLVGNVIVSGTDVGVIGYVAPASEMDPDTVTPAIQVMNYSSGLRDLIAYLTVETETDSVVFCDSAVATGVVPDSVFEVTFSDWVAASGRYRMTASVVTPGDRNPTNDTLRAACLVYTHDVGIAMINSPASIMRPVTVNPIVKVANYGNSTENLWAFMLMQDSVSGTTVYFDSAEVTGLRRGEEISQLFSPWTPAIGYYRVASYTVMAGDVAVSNDTCRVLVKVTPGAIGWQLRRDVPTGTKPVRHGGCLTGIEGADKLYALKGYKTSEFYEYNVPANSWLRLADIPLGPRGRPVKLGADICTDNSRYLYAVKGNRTLEFYKFDTQENNWTQLADIPAGAKTLRYGTGLAFVSRDERELVYCMKASRTREFYVYFVDGDSWAAREQLPVGSSGRPYKKGCALVEHGNDRLFAVKGRYNEFFKYDIAANSWEQKPSMPLYGYNGKKAKAKDGCDLTSDGNGIYAFSGGNRDFFFAYWVGADRWSELAPLPLEPSGRKVKQGGSVHNLGRQIWTLKGNKTYEFWAYTPDTMVAFGRDCPERSGIALDGIRPIRDSRFEIRPNPLVGRVAAIENRSETAARVRLVSSLGTVLTESRLLPQSIVRMDLNGLPAGTYFVRLDAGDATETRKLILQE